MAESAYVLFFWLLVGHSIADYGLQTDWLEKHKQRSAWAHLPVAQRINWIFPLTAHASIHAGAVAFATGSITLGLAELSAHWLIDFAKGEGKFGFALDQFLHILCKLAWVAILFV
ncbi:MAG TPA: DUF3307 domain-containing protein [Gammaproteobacteria bacterium]|jgi:hypothetical protein|nr:DUF3307 domain-containing protein [Gammaproteobacteria bacterium]